MSSEEKNNKQIIEAMELLFFSFCACEKKIEFVNCMLYLVFVEIFTSDDKNYSRETISGNVRSITFTVDLTNKKL